MANYEKLGAFYLGRPYDLAQRKLDDGLLLYDSRDLVTHAVCVGMTGSGKTGLCVTLLEEAAIDGIPALVIDPKGDLGNLLLTFPELRSQDFQPWINEDDARRKGLSVEEYSQKQADLWDCLYLSMEELARLVAHVEEKAGFPFIHPMFCFAVYTGARRSELMRSQVCDIDFAAKFVTIREKKRVRGKLTTRRIPLSQPLTRVLREWFNVHPGGPHTFCHFLKVERSKTKRTDPIALTKDEAHHHFKQTLIGSKWEVIRGWHCFRHSFISNCASKGVDQRMIDEWVGHSTEAMRRRYRHLFPSSQQDAMRMLFR